MLSGYSAAVVGLIGDGFVIHPRCAAERYGDAVAATAENGMYNSAGLQPIIRYTAESEWPEGLSCDHCYDWITEPQYDIWHDPDGVWRQIGAQTYGPFESEEEAEKCCANT